MNNNAEVVLRVDDETVAVSFTREQMQSIFAALSTYVDELLHDALAAIGNHERLSHLHTESETAEDALDTVTKALRILSRPLD
jgi:hypothetical protein